MLAGLQGHLKGTDMSETKTLPLTEDQVSQYHEDGFILVSGLVPEDIARRGEDAMCEVMMMDRNDPGTWT